MYPLPESWQDGPVPEQFFIGAEIAVAVAALVALQTRIHIARDGDGKWSFEFEKSALGDELVKTLLQKMGIL